MNTNIITMKEFLKRSGKTWKITNDCEFRGVIPGYVCGWNLEVEKDGKIDCGSCVFDNDYEVIRNSIDDYNDLGISEELCSYNGWKATGNIVFRGYFTEHYDFEEREEYYTDASEEVENLWKKYVVA